ncbi:MAG: efflux RND transporter periplasmic adaptor subunit [Ruminococcus sp.]|jgi:multidrug efflux pump subunit AcrA (membrane-fusion protein)|nr:efflux RND transporter periplasmic adaptor subunit [Ruminococcus sp.]
MKKRYIIIPLICAAVIGSGVCIAVNVNNAMQAMASLGGSTIEELHRQDLQNYITASGTIESSDINKIYSDLIYPIESVNVSVGDVVKKGDILCTIDTETLEQKISEQEAAMKTSDQNTDYNITDAEKAYNDALADYENGDNTQIISAQNALDNAENALEAAQKSYDDARERQGTDKDTQLRSAELSLAAAKTGLANARKAYDKAVDNQKNEDYFSIKQLSDAYDTAKENRDIARSHEAEVIIATAYSDYLHAKSVYESYANATSLPMPEGTTLADFQADMTNKKAAWQNYIALYDITTAEDALEAATEAYEDAKESLDKANENAVDQAETALESAERQLESAQMQYDATLTGNTDTIETLEENLENAQIAYNKAKNSYDLTVTTVLDNLDTLKTQAQRARDRSDNTSAQVALQNLYDQLEEATITAPVDGTVTYENVMEGIAPTGVLFVIEDTSDLLIKVGVSEYDVVNITPDMKCEIVPNAMTDLTYDGVIRKVAPAASKAATGDDAGMGSFEATVAVTSRDTALLIGMTARINIITEEKKNILSVSSDLILSDDGGSYVYAATGSGEGGVYTAKKVYVTTGMETAFYIEVTPVTAGEIDDGSKLLTRPQNLTDGQTVTVNQGGMNFGTNSNFDVAVQGGYGPASPGAGGPPPM